MPTLKLEERVQIRTDYLSGYSTSELVDKYKRSRDLVLKILNDDDAIARRLTEEGILQKMSKETDKIMDIKNEATDTLRLALISAKETEEPHLFIDKIAKAIETLDRVQRLNQSRPTDITENRTTITNFDVAALTAQLDTPEKKKEYLKKQLNYDRDTKDKFQGTTSPFGHKVVATS
jgi:hypothetical protein